MKKYIRTKTGHICKIRSKQKRLNGEYDTWYGNPSTSFLYNFNHEVIDRESDNLEELCDDFVLVAPYRFKRPKTATELDKDFEEMRYFYTDKDDTIYGSIWDGATLKAVAKWNPVKEEWDLL